MRPPRPTRVCRNSTGPPSSSRISSAAHEQDRHRDDQCGGGHQQVDRPLGGALRRGVAQGLEHHERFVGDGRAAQPGVGEAGQAAREVDRQPDRRHGGQQVVQRAGRDAVDGDEHAGRPGRPDRADDIAVAAEVDRVGTVRHVRGDRRSGGVVIAADAARGPEARLGVEVQERGERVRVGPGAGQDDRAEEAALAAAAQQPDVEAVAGGEHRQEPAAGRADREAGGGVAEHGLPPRHGHGRDGERLGQRRRGRGPGAMGGRPVEPEGDEAGDAGEHADGDVVELRCGRGCDAAGRPRHRHPAGGPAAGEGDDVERGEPHRQPSVPMSFWSLDGVCVVDARRAVGSVRQTRPVPVLQGDPHDDPLVVRPTRPVRRDRRRVSGPRLKRH